MNNLHPVMAQTLRGFMPPTALRFNDDDLYIYRTDSLELVDVVSDKSIRRTALKYGTEKLSAGLSFAAGMTAKRLKLWSKS